MVWLLEVKVRGYDRLLVLTEYANTTDGRTDGQTPHDGIGCA